MPSNHTSLISDLSGMFAAKQFKPFISKIIFPQFKSLEADSTINFHFPITVFVGQNGSGKSSCLYALQGAPFGQNVQNFWFTTRMDPIPEEVNGRRASYAYNYLDKNGNEKETVFYMRVKKDGDPDYWETSYPTTKYGLTPQKKRTRPVSMPVVYIDFRAILSSFDKYTNFLYDSHKIKSSRNNFLRLAARKIANIFGNVKEYKNTGFKNVIDLPKAEIEWINKILAKNYSACRILKHDFHRELGECVKFELKDKKTYSDAFAGSGEISVVQIVHQVMSAKRGSLILLDEPEVSLHPGAQTELMGFLLEQCKIKKHQIIISTHSPFLIDNLPPEAIKSFSNLGNGTFKIIDECKPEDAFVRIGYKGFTKKTILVEDDVAKILLSSVLAKIDKKDQFDFSSAPGGHDGITRVLVDTIRYNLGCDKLYAAFDGDQFVDDMLPESTAIPDTDIKVFFEKYVGTVRLGADETYNLIQQKRDILDFYKTNHVFYLPEHGHHPEKILWDIELGKEFLKQYTSKTDTEINTIVEEIDQLSYDKEKVKNIYSKLAEYRSARPTSYDIKMVIDYFIGKWLLKNDNNYKIIKNWLESL